MSGIEGIVAPLAEVSIARSDMPAYHLAWRGVTPGPKTIAVMDKHNGYFLEAYGHDVFAQLSNARYLHIVKIEDEVSAFISNGMGRPSQILQPGVAPDLADAITSAMGPHRTLATLEPIRQNHFFLTGPRRTGSATLDAATRKRAWLVRYVEDLSRGHEVEARRIELVEVLR